MDLVDKIYAALTGNRNLRRYAGNALHKNPSNAITPDDFEMMRARLI